MFLKERANPGLEDTIPSGLGDTSRREARQSQAGSFLIQLIKPIHLVNFGSGSAGLGTARPTLRAHWRGYAMAGSTSSGDQSQRPSMPPAMTRFWPVMWRERISDDRKIAALAISSGRANCGKAMVAVTLRTAPASVSFASNRGTIVQPGEMQLI